MNNELPISIAIHLKHEINYNWPKLKMYDHKTPRTSEALNFSKKDKFPRTCGAGG